ncbi:transporter [Rhodococcus oxybenzonivorans]|uniref:Transporter n=1 Tax=Rhodococcus oxybenzonivorans TaxID=1990687 RepID=A0A2S2BW14_9NOCA|nr:MULTISPECIES: transporter [Rhodococcus]AWK72830.1 transporter [Rhodococcus oxybenzonivorans]QTJ69467.1 transporter [Rhodococcus sp. ZPP]
MERILWIVGLAAFWALAIYLMYVGWRGRARRQADRIGQLPSVPAHLGAQTIAPATGLYVGSTLAPSWQDRIAVGDLGFRATGEISRYHSGILLERDGASAIWIPQDAIRAVRTERGLAGKVMSKDGLLVIRWALPSGTEIDTGFRSDDKSVYPVWINSGESGGTTDSEDSANAASSGEVEQNGENA